jgi:hypothetical protein
VTFQVLGFLLSLFVNFFADCFSVDQLHLFCVPGRGRRI